MKAETAAGFYSLYTRYLSFFATLFAFSLLRYKCTALVSPARLGTSVLPHYHRSIPRRRTKMSTAAAATNAETITNATTIRHLDEKLLPKGMLKQRTRILTSEDVGERSTAASAAVVYWMQRDMRTSDNWALTLASHLAQHYKVPLRVVYALPPPPSTNNSNEDGDTRSHPPALIDLPMTRRHADFLLGGLEHVHKELREHSIPFHIVQATSHGNVGSSICETLETLCPGDSTAVVVADFSPLRHYRQWMELQALPLLEAKGIPFYQVDAHNVVPVWTASPKREVGARTLRSKINKVISDYLTDLPNWEPEKLANRRKKDDLVLPSFDRKEYEEFLKIDESVSAVSWAVRGTKGGMDQFNFFVKNSLSKYDTLRNDPTQSKICSNLSPWINHGHISFQKVARETKKLNKYANGTASFLEEGIIRRELSDNYVYYSPNDYDSLSAAAGWAQATLDVHSSDPREYVYSLDELEDGKTHDDLWNAAQLQVVKEGQMHGFLRMYWAKKILEWTESPTVALETAQYFNDKYALDGKDPNGFVGVGWSIMGIHDQGWKEREVFGKIRFMNYNGCKRKFKVETFVGRYPEAAKNAAKGKRKDEGAPTKKSKTQKTA